MWMGLVRGRALALNPEAKSIAEDLLKSLHNFSGIIKESRFIRDLSLPECPDAAVGWNEGSKLAHRLIQNQACAEKLAPFCPNEVLYPAVLLNHELLQHLVPDPPLGGLPSPSSPPMAPDFNLLLKSLQCVACWSQQVEALL